jgi:hypothetical protein
MGQSIPDMPPRRDNQTLSRLSQHAATPPENLRRELIPDEIALWATYMAAGGDSGGETCDSGTDSFGGE